MAPRSHLSLILAIALPMALASGQLVRFDQWLPRGAGNRIAGR